MGVGIYASSHQKTDLTGYVVLYPNTGVDDTSFVGTSACHGTNGFDDLASGLPVNAEAADGTDLGTANLSGGTVKEGNCVFTFTFHSVKQSTQYKITVGLANLHGSLSYPYDQRDDMEVAFNKA